MAHTRLLLTLAAHATVHRSPYDNACNRKLFRVGSGMDEFDSVRSDEDKHKANKLITDDPEVKADRKSVV